LTFGNEIDACTKTSVKSMLRNQEGLLANTYVLEIFESGHNNTELPVN